MLLDIENQMLVLVPLLVLIGTCLAVYGKEVYKHTAFFIGAVTGGILAYMVLEGLLGPYEVPLIAKVLVSFVIVILGGLVGQGASAMIVAFLCSLTVIDLLMAFLPESLSWVAYVAGTLMFVLVLIIVQRFIVFFTSLTGGIIIAASLHPVLSFLDGMIAIPVQVLIALGIGVAGYFIQKKLESIISARKEEIVWVPTPQKRSSSR